MPVPAGVANDGHCPNPKRIEVSNIKDGRDGIFIGTDFYDASGRFWQVKSHRRFDDSLRSDDTIVEL